MALSAEIVHLMAEEEKKLSIDFIRLHPSRNYRERATDRSHRSTSESEEAYGENVKRPDTMRRKLNDSDQVSTLRREWQEFHNSNRYRFFDEFYYKHVFCTYENIRQISDQGFLTLISDRSFLFPEHSDQAQDVEYPAIYAICKVDQKRLYKPDNIDEVRREGIVPTTGHLQAYERLCANRKRLIETMERRERNLLRYRMRHGADNIQDGTPIFTIRFGNVLENDTSTSESSPVGDGEMARKLSCLFYNYMEALSTRGYRTGLSHYLKLEKTDWEEELRSVYEFLLREAPDWNPALVFFCLFTEYTTPLASHRLKKFDFALKSAAKRAEEPIGQVQLTLSRKYECQIMLYDHLLDLLLQTASPEEISYAKFEFYARTSYQWYTHYRLPQNSHTASEYDPSFHMAPDFGDGVDELGNLMRNCINFCFPNGYEWLAIHPQNRVRFNTVEPKTLLLSEASLIRPSQRLITKIRHFLEQEKGKELKQKYARIAYDTKKVIHLLDACCKEQEFHFYYEILLSEYEITKPEYIHVYSRLLLEHELREQMYEEARKNLRRIAQEKFGALFLTDDPFGISS